LKIKYDLFSNQGEQQDWFEGFRLGLEKSGNKNARLAEAEPGASGGKL
jgi:hypothetical protein